MSKGLGPVQPDRQNHYDHNDDSDYLTPGQQVQAKKDRTSITAI